MNILIHILTLSSTSHQFLNILNSPLSNQNNLLELTESSNPINITNLSSLSFLIVFYNLNKIPSQNQNSELILCFIGPNNSNRGLTLQETISIIHHADKSKNYLETKLKIKNGFRKILLKISLEEYNILFQNGKINFSEISSQIFFSENFPEILEIVSKDIEAKIPKSILSSKKNSKIIFELPFFSNFVEGEKIFLEVENVNLTQDEGSSIGGRGEMTSEKYFYNLLFDNVSISTISVGGEEGIIRTISEGSEEKKWFENKIIMGFIIFVLLAMGMVSIVIGFLIMNKNNE